MLAHLLLEQPVPGLGDDHVPVKVALQQSAITAVDDVVITGRSPSGERVLQLACRSRPTIGRSDESTVKLFASFLQVVLEQEMALAGDQLRLGLGVSGTQGPAQELATLTDIARLQFSSTAFQAAVEAPLAYEARIRDRLRLVEDVVVAALTALGVERSAPELTWRLLRSLFVLGLRLEGETAVDRTDLVGKLQAVAATPAAAALLRLQLVELAGKGGIRAGALTPGMVRREVRSFGLLNGSPSFKVARPNLDLLEAELRRQVHRVLGVAGGASPISLDRTGLQSQLVECISSAKPGAVVLVTGEPDVGKSSLALGAIDAIRLADGAAIVMSLRDLPSGVQQLWTAFGIPFSALFETAPSGPMTVLLLDGAEVTQEQGGGTLAALVVASSRAGRTVVLPVRDDAVGTIRECLTPLGLGEVVEVSVAPLQSSEVGQVIAAIPTLRPFSEDPRSAWLLRRLGLIDLLLKAADATGELPASLSSEADVFAAVWHGLVRQGERTVDGVSPDDRDAAVVAVARGVLAGSTTVAPPGPVLSRLRSDGVLLRRGWEAAWQAGDRFASDVLRDYGTARLLLGSGLPTLSQAAAPRWAVRAARLYAQARFSEAIVAGGFIERWDLIRLEFQELAKTYGARWAELPWEAVLTAGWADHALDLLTDRLKSDDALRAEAIRCLVLRMSTMGACDPVRGVPLVSWLVRQGYLAPETAQQESEVPALVLSWLRGVARLEVAGDDVTRLRDVRQLVRDQLLGRWTERYPEALIEGFGLLGTDSNSPAVERLRRLADEQPHLLPALVESLDAAVLLAQQDVGLLAKVTEAYYIQAQSAPEWVELDDEGIRRHQPRGLTGPLAAWHRGPFLPLLRSSWALGMRVINRMMEVGARSRLSGLGRLGTLGASDVAQDEGADLELFGLPRRLYIGDDHVWGWYRGSRVGPYPCMSALFALELRLDELVRAGRRPRDMAHAVLAEASTLAEVGLAYGFLVRHIGAVTDELDQFLEQPVIWDLEFRRVVAEPHLHVQGKDPESLQGLERRKWEPRTVALYLAETARRRGDTARLARLAEVGQHLIDAAGGPAAPAHVRAWAACLDATNFSVRSGDSVDVIEVVIADEIQDALAGENAATAEFNETLRLMNRYRVRELTPYLHATATITAEVVLHADVRSAIAIAASLKGAREEDLFLRPALAGVAASIVESGARGMRHDPPTRRWAVETLLECLRASLRTTDSNYGVFGDGADRKVALSLPFALAGVALRDAPGVEDSRGDDERDDRSVFYRVVRRAAKALGFRRQAEPDPVHKGILTCTTTLVREVRERAGEGCGAASELPCSVAHSEACWHVVLWEAIEAGLRAVRVGRPGLDGPRELLMLAGPLDQALVEASPNDLMFTHLTPMVTCVLRVARGRSCLAAKARELREALLDVWSATAMQWNGQDFEWLDEQVAALVSEVLRTQLSDGLGWVERVARNLGNSPGTLAGYLRGLVVATTYETELVPILQSSWPFCMELGLAALCNCQDAEDRLDFEQLIANLVPAPHPLAHYDGSDEVLRRARAQWLSLSSISDNVEAWLQAARYTWGCIDTLVGFLECQPVTVQLDQGLRWVRVLVVGTNGSAQSSGFTLLPWLTRLRNQSPKVAVSSDYRVIVDALVLGNYTGARELQQRDE